jgi:hypothetical protein
MTLPHTGTCHHEAFLTVVLCQSSCVMTDEEKIIVDKLCKYYATADFGLAFVKASIV